MSSDRIDPDLHAIHADPSSPEEPYPFTTKMENFSRNIKLVIIKSGYIKWPIMKGGYIKRTQDRSESQNSG